MIQIMENGIIQGKNRTSQVAIFVTCDINCQFGNLANASHAFLLTTSGCEMPDNVA